MEARVQGSKVPLPRHSVPQEARVERTWRFIILPLQLLYLLFSVHFYFASIFFLYCCSFKQKTGKGILPIDRNIHFEVLLGIQVACGWVLWAET